MHIQGHVRAHAHTYELYYIDQSSLFFIPQRHCMDLAVVLSNHITSDLISANEFSERLRNEPEERSRLLFNLFVHSCIHPFI